MLDACKFFEHLEAGTLPDPGQFFYNIHDDHVVAATTICEVLLDNFQHSTKTETMQWNYFQGNDAIHHFNQHDHCRYKFNLIANTGECGECGELW